MINSIFSLFGRRGIADRQRSFNERVQRYARYLRAYQGYSIRGVLNTNVVQDWRRLKFNFNAPICNLSAGWFAAKPLDFEVRNSPEATAEAYAIWARSGGDAALLENALCCSIYGDVCGLATQDGDGRSRLEFVDPSIVTPQFSGSDYSELASLEIAYEQMQPDGEVTIRRELWDARRMEAFVDTKLVDSRAYDLLPAVWIRNTAVKGLPI